MSSTVYIGAFVTVGLFLLSHLCLAIWFASKTNAKVGEMAEDLREVVTSIKEMAMINTRITVLEQRMSRTEEDTREALKATAKIAADRKS